MKEKIAAVIPAFNEAGTIAAIVDEVKKYVDVCIVVDDCSADATGKSAEDAGAKVVHHEVNRGYDTSIDDGFRAALSQGADIIFTLDADGQHSPQDIARVLVPILEGHADVVLGTRPERAQPAEYAYAWYTKYRYGISDPLCGFKAYRRDIYERFGPFDTLRSIGTELALRSIKAGARFELVPITLRKRADTSRFYFRRLRGNMRILAALWRVIRSI